MKAAMVLEAGQTPVFGDFKEPAVVAGDVRIHVTAAALSNVVRSRASGTHYSSSGDFPFVVGIDGVGRLDDGRRVYFALPKAPLGSMSERTAVRAAQCVAVPDDLDDVTAAAIANPGVSAWAALQERAKLVAGETVLINGATGTAGRLAVQIAKYMGAKKVIATGRNIDVLNTLPSLGADVTIPLAENGDALDQAFQAQFADGVSVVVDYLWGRSAERLIIAGAKAGRDAVPIRFVHVGSVSGPNITLPSAALRSSAMELMGSGIGSIPLDRLLSATKHVLAATIPGGFQIATRSFPLSAIEQTWSSAGNTPRAVLLMS